MIFSRDKQTDGQFSATMKTMAWVILVYNCITVFPYFFDAMPKASIMQRIFGSASATFLMMGIEAAAITAMFNPKIIIFVLEKPRTNDDGAANIAYITSRVGMVLFLLMASYTFWFDYQINIMQMGASKVFFLKVLAGIFVLGSEIAFACANIFHVASESNASDIKR